MNVPVEVIRFEVFEYLLEPGDWGWRFVVKNWNGREEQTFMAGLGSYGSRKEAEEGVKVFCESFASVPTVLVEWDASVQEMRAVQEEPLEKEGKE